MALNNNQTYTDEGGVNKWHEIAVNAQQQSNQYWNQYPKPTTWADLWNSGNQEYVDNVFYSPEPEQEPEQEQTVPEIEQPKVQQEPESNPRRSGELLTEEQAPEPVKTVNEPEAPVINNVFTPNLPVVEEQKTPEPEPIQVPVANAQPKVTPYTNTATQTQQGTESEFLTREDLLRMTDNPFRPSLKDQPPFNWRGNNMVLEEGYDPLTNALANTQWEYQDDFGFGDPYNTGTYSWLNKPVENIITEPRRSGELRAEDQVPIYEQTDQEVFQEVYKLAYELALQNGLSIPEARAYGIDKANIAVKNTNDQKNKNNSYTILNMDPGYNAWLAETGEKPGTPADLYENVLKPFGSEIASIAGDLAESAGNLNYTENAFNNMREKKYLDSIAENYDPAEARNMHGAVPQNYNKEAVRNQFLESIQPYRNDLFVGNETGETSYDPTENRNMHGQGPRQYGKDAYREQYVNEIEPYRANPFAGTETPETSYDPTEARNMHGQSSKDYYRDVRREQENKAIRDNLIAENIIPNLFEGNPLAQAYYNTTGNLDYSGSPFDWDVTRASNIFNNLPAGLTDQQKIDYINSLYQGTETKAGYYDSNGVWHDPEYGNDNGLFHFDPVGAHGNYLPEDIAIPTWDNNQGNEAMVWALERTREQNDEGKYVEVWAHTPHEILTLFVNTMLDGGDPNSTAWRGLENVPQEVKDKLLANLVHGGDPDFYRLNSDHKLEYFNGSAKDFERLANEFINSMPALQKLIDEGVITRDDVAKFFFKSPKTGSNTGNYSGGGGGYRSYYGGGGGYTPSSYTPRKTNYYTPGNYGKVSNNPVSATSASQQQNRVYNIMKNWSF